MLFSHQFIEYFHNIPAIVAGTDIHHTMDQFGPNLRVGQRKVEPCALSPDVVGTREFPSLRPAVGNKGVDQSTRLIFINMVLHPNLWVKRIVKSSARVQQTGGGRPLSPRRRIASGVKAMRRRGERRSGRSWEVQKTGLP